MSTDTGVTPSEAVKDADAALERLQKIVERLADGDLHLAHRNGGWTVAQVISHINVCTILWLGDLQRLHDDPELTFFFREEIGHDCTGYPPPTVERATRQLASTRRSLAHSMPGTDDALMGRTVEIPDLGTMTIAEWTPLIAGHLAGHVDQALDVLRDRDALPDGA